ncbi:MAG: hypothetical protein M9893_07970 [Pyrinomonadaceae bacterium]|nr:hypothetical protein [Pyrinomonadaceae bacterium]
MVIRKSSDNSVFATQFGSSTDRRRACRRTTRRRGAGDVLTSGTAGILRSEDLTYYADQFGTTGDVPSPGDYDGDGKADVAVFRPTGSTWYVKLLDRRLSDQTVRLTKETVQASSSADTN